MVQFLHVNPQDVQNNPVDNQKIDELGDSQLFTSFCHAKRSKICWFHHVRHRTMLAVGRNLPSAEPDGCSVGAHEPPAKVAAVEICGLDHFDFTNKPRTGAPEMCFSDFLCFSLMS